MKKKLSFIVLINVLVVILCFMPGFSMAQVDPNPADPGGDPDLPIDGGVTVLVAAGIGYGIKKIRDERKKQLNKLP